MENEGYYSNTNITSFLLESMVYLLPTSYYSIYSDSYSWNDILRKAIVYWFNATKADNSEWNEWKEVSELLPLMRGHKWSRADVNEFTVKMWNYLGYA